MKIKLNEHLIIRVISARFLSCKQIFFGGITSTCMICKADK